MSTCIARQPIFNSRMDIFGYELLYRQSSESTAYDGTDGDAASSRTIMNSFHDIGINRVTGGKRAFVNFTERLLLDKVPTLLPSRVLVVEVLETVQPTPAVLNACNTLRRQGYTLALDDFILQPEYMPLLDVADIVKIDFLASSPRDILTFSQQVKGRNIKLLAEKLETQEAFEQAKSMGFTLFQGYFFSKPAIVASTEAALSPLRVNCVQLLRLAFQQNVNFAKISDVVKQDVALSYRLLRVVNSAFFGLRYTVKNIRQALSILGMDEVKKWITLISLAELREGKPDELIQMSLLRARMLELLAPVAGLAKESEPMFLMGMMSLMDVIMDLSFDEIAEQTSISTSIFEPIITGEGRFGRLLRMVIHYERSEFDEALAIAAEHRISADDLLNCYVEAADWAGILTR